MPHRDDQDAGVFSDEDGPESPRNIMIRAAEAHGLDDGWGGAGFVIDSILSALSEAGYVVVSQSVLDDALQGGHYVMKQIGQARTILGLLDEHIFSVITNPLTVAAVAPGAEDVR